MKAEKAIEILNDLLGDGPQFSPDCRRKAVMLGIEALKRELNYRGGMPPEKGELLPGETEEATDGMDT